MSQPKHRGNYPPDWKDIAKLIKDEARWRCVRCAAPHNIEGGYMLTVHHFDGDKANVARWNLMALCQRCHLSVQARVDPMVPLMFDPAPWCMPYIAGFYEAKHGEPGPLYNLARWIEEYEANRDACNMRHTWPDWAPKPPP